MTRLRLRVRGIVQGVGFRPYAYGLARSHGLSGFVRNDGEGVLIEVEGRRAPSFVEALQRAPPPLARIEAVEVESCAALGDAGFCIAASAGGATRTRIGADAAICEACLDDVFDPASRFHRYPLVNCTHCGPRYTITRALPYDRAQTSMAPFAMCADCARDYGDPGNRRFHAEPIACGACGPKLDAEIDEVAACIAGGGVAAVKGLGGFHLICDARNAAAVARLRACKARERKPLAVMVLNAASADAFAWMSAAERALFEGRTAPIVLMKPRRALAPGVAPGLAEIGWMRAYTPLHWLIFHALLGRPAAGDWRRAACEIALVVTSANLRGEPLIADEAEARGLPADVIVGHARKIVARADDSVMRVIDGAPVYLRRARGFAPDPVDLGRDGPSVIAYGGDLKNTVTITRGREAFVTPYLGDLDNRRTIRFRDETVAHLLSLLDVKPEFAACDLHPDFQSTRAAEDGGLPLRRVQHHVAHVEAAAAEAGWDGEWLGVALDGFGYGFDGGAWGGELIVSGRRVGSLKPLPLPGGDRAAREPWRMAAGVLRRLGRDAEAVFPGAARLDYRLQTTSLGRVFDAAAALAGVCLKQDYEGEAAMRLEALVDELPAVSGLWRIEGGALDLLPLLAALPGEARAAASLFHAGLIAALAEWIGARRMRRVALGGGCLMNRVLAEGLAAALRARGLEVALPRALPANDGGLSFGQAVVALQSLR